MGKTLTINMNKVGEVGKVYNFDAKGISKIQIIYDGSVIPDNFTKTSVSGSNLTLKLCDMWTYKLKNIPSSTINITFKKANGTVQYTGTLEQFYEFMTGSINGYTVNKNVVTGTIFNDVIDFHAKNYKGKGYTFNAGKGNDTVTGTKYADIINGGEGKDTLIGGKGSDKLTGGKGNNIFVFSKADGGTDTITDAKKGDEIKITDVAREDMLFAKNGNNLEIYYSDDYNSSNKIIVQNHFKNKVVDRIVKLTDKNHNMVDLSSFTATNVDFLTGSGKITGTSKGELIVGSTGADTIKAGGGNDTVVGKNGNDILYGEAGDDVIIAGKGSDKIYGGAGKNTIVFDSGDGSDIVYSNGGTDTLQFNNFETLDDLKAGVKLVSDGTNLKIKYTSSDVVTIDKYYKNTTNSVKGVADAYGNTLAISELITSVDSIAVSGSGTITGTNGNDKITGSAKADTIKALAGNDIINAGKGDDKIYGGLGDDKINAGAGKNNIYYSLGHGNDTIVNGGGTDTLVFDKGITVSAVYSGKDLIVKYSGSKNGANYSNTIKIENYKTSSSVKYVKIGDSTKTIDKYIDKGGSGKTYISTGENEYWGYSWNNMTAGNHTFLYDLANADPEYKHFGGDLIQSPNNSANGYTDTFQFNNHSIQRHDNKMSINIKYNRPDDVMINTWNDTFDPSGIIQYIDIDENKPNLVIKDADGITYNVKAYNTPSNIDNSKLTTNNISLIYVRDGQANSVIANNKYNYTVSGSANLTYTYNGVTIELIQIRTQVILSILIHLIQHLL